MRQRPNRIRGHAGDAGRRLEPRRRRHRHALAGRKLAGRWLEPRRHLEPHRLERPRAALGRPHRRALVGMRAPGGVRAAYRRPVRGWVLPSYWVAPSWYVSDWSAYGLPQPPQGYNWSRYYDDAVLVDGRGDATAWAAWAGIASTRPARTMAITGTAVRRAGSPIRRAMPTTASAAR
ncbi:RcnB family protein [Sphingomonas sp. MMS24-JH45]